MVDQSTYIRRAKAIRAAQEHTDASIAGDRLRLQQRREQQLQRDREKSQRHQANQDALRRRQNQLEPLVTQVVTEQLGTRPWTLDNDHEHAMGMSIIAGGRVVAVICPIASRITAEVAARLGNVTVYVASEHERRAVARRCHRGQQPIVLSEPVP